MTTKRRSKACFSATLNLTASFAMAFLKRGIIQASFHFSQFGLLYLIIT